MKNLRMTWQDALIIELEVTISRVKEGMRVAGITTTRLQGLIDEYHKELELKKKQKNSENL